MRPLIALEAGLLFRLGRDPAGADGFTGSTFIRVQDGAADAVRACLAAGRLALWSMDPLCTGRALTEAWAFARASAGLEGRPALYGCEHWAETPWGPARKRLHKLAGLEDHPYDWAVALDDRPSTVDPPDRVALVAGQTVRAVLEGLDWDGLADRQPDRIAAGPSLYGQAPPPRRSRAGAKPRHLRWAAARQERYEADRANRRQRAEARLEARKAAFTREGRPPRPPRRPRQPRRPGRPTGPDPPG